MFSIDSWANPGYLYLLAIIPLLIVWYWFRHRNREPEMNFSDLGAFEGETKSSKVWLRHSLFVLRLLALGLLIVAMARPQSTSRKKNISVEGIDIVMALDVSSSMLARDFKPDRLEAAKKIAKKCSKIASGAHFLWQNVVLYECNKKSFYRK